MFALLDQGLDMVFLSSHRGGKDRENLRVGERRGAYINKVYEVWVNRGEKQERGERPFLSP